MFTRIATNISALSNDIPIPTRIEMIARAGFPVVDIDFFSKPIDERFSAEDILAMKTAFGNVGANPGAAHGYFAWGDADGPALGASDDTLRAKAIARYKHEIDVCREIGIRTIVMHLAYRVSDDAYTDTLARVKDGLLDLLTYANGDVRFACENLPDSPQTVRLMLETVDAFPGEQVGICFDSGHSTISGYLKEIVDERVARIFAVHLHDNYGYTDNHLLPLMGIVAFDEIIPKLQNAATDTLMVELAPRPIDSETYLQKAHECGTLLLSGTYETQTRFPVRLYEYSAAAMEKVWYNKKEFPFEIAINDRTLQCYLIPEYTNDVEKLVAWDGLPFTSNVGSFKVQNGVLVLRKYAAVISPPIPLAENETLTLSFAMRKQFVKVGEKPYMGADVLILFADDEGNIITYARTTPLGFQDDSDFVDYEVRDEHMHRFATKAYILFRKYQGSEGRALISNVRVRTSTHKE